MTVDQLMEFLASVPGHYGINIQVTMADAPNRKYNNRIGLTDICVDDAGEQVIFPGDDM